METALIQKTRTMFIMKEIIPDADTKTFIIMGDYFGKDAKNAYYKDQLLKGVDAQSFKRR